MLLSNNTYDVLKYIAQIVLPALGTLYYTLTQIWGLPFGPEIVGTITAIDAFLGCLLKISSTSYYNSIEADPGIEEKEKEVTDNETSVG